MGRLRGRDECTNIVDSDRYFIYFACLPGARTVLGAEGAKANLTYSSSGKNPALVKETDKLCNTGSYRTK